MKSFLRPYLFKLSLIIALIGLTGLPGKAFSEETEDFKKYPYLYHFAKGDGYLDLDIGIFVPKNGQFNLLRVFFQAPLFRKTKWSLLSTNDLYVPHDSGAIPLFISSHTKFRLRNNQLTHFKPFVAVGLASLKGEDTTLSETGISTGIGSEFFWEAKKAPLGIYAYFETGALFMFDKSVRYYVNSRYQFFFWKVPLNKSKRPIYFMFNINGELNYASGSEELGLFAALGPRFSFLFPNKQQVSISTKWMYNRGYPFQVSPDNNSLLFSLNFQTPLGSNAIHSDSGLGSKSYSPTMNASLTYGVGLNQLVMSELDIDFLAPLFLRDKFQIQFSMKYILGRYFRTGPNLSGHVFEVGPRFLIGHPSDRPFVQRPYWGIGAFFKHRSEHASNPGPDDMELNIGSNPESIFIRATSPYWDDQVWNKNRSKWIDYLSLSLVLNRFISAEDPERGGTTFSVRPGISINMAKVGKGLFYLRGEKAFFGTDFLDWRAEFGWKRKKWAIFIRGENLDILSPVGGVSRNNYYAGMKFYYSQEPQSQKD